MEQPGALPTPEPKTLLGGRGGVTSVAFSPDGKLLASASLDGLVQVWETGRWAGKRFFSVPSANCIQFSPDGKSLAVAGEEVGRPIGFVRCWDIVKGKITATIVIPGGGTVFAFSPCGKYMATGRGYKERGVQLWNPGTGEEVKRLSGTKGYVKALAYSRDGRLLAAGDSDGAIRCWETDSWKEVGTIGAHSKAVLSLAYSPEGSFLVSGSEEPRVRYWEAKTLEEKEGIVTESRFVEALAFPRDGKLLAVGGHRHLQLWEVALGRPKEALAGHKERILALAFSPDGHFIATGSLDNTVKVWDLRGR
jgi:WD40 repeat protein